MKHLNTYLFACLLFAALVFKAQPNWLVLSGRVLSQETGQPIEGAGIKLSQSVFSTMSDKQGYFYLRLPPREQYNILFFHVACESVSRLLKRDQHDTLLLLVNLKTKMNLLDEVGVSLTSKPETLVGKPNFSIYDFDFIEDKYLLLTAENSLKNAQIKLCDQNAYISATYNIPKAAGRALYFYKDYEGYTDLVCEDSVFRIDVVANDLLVTPIRRNLFSNYLLPVSDSAFNKLYVNDWSKDYPAFTHYSVGFTDSLATALINIKDEELMDLYNFEYYFLPPRMQLEARRIAQQYKTDVHVVAALMSGFTQSMFYESLYAPLFVLNDTICIFHHYKNTLYHFNKQNQLIDSVPINYHHPKNWRHWKKQLIVDEPQNAVYAFYSRDGRHYVKRIDPRTGKELLTYHLQNYSGKRLKIKDGFAYYIYKPFDTTQEFFLYRERIR